MAEFPEPGDMTVATPDTSPDTSPETSPVIRRAVSPVTSPVRGPVVLFGSTGFIGRRIQTAVCASGCALRAIVRPNSRKHHQVDSRCERVECALDDERGLAAALAGAGAVVYCAGCVRGGSLDDFLPANVEGVKAVLRTLQVVEPKVPVLLISSLAASRPHLSDYARSKFLAEAEFQKHTNGAWTILRPPAVYGPGDREMRVILDMLRRGFIVHAGPRDQRVSLLHVDDLASAVTTWLGAWHRCQGSTYAIDDGRPGAYDWNAMATAAGYADYRRLRIPAGLLNALAYGNLMFSRLSGRAPMLTPGKVRELTEATWLCDNTAFTAATGWRPRIDLAAGLNRIENETPDRGVSD